MKQTVELYDFEQAFHAYERFDNFGYDGLKALFNYLTELEEDCGVEMELDVIALCCDYTRYEDLDELNKEYREEFKTLDEVRDHTTVIEIEDSEAFIIQCY